MLGREELLERIRTMDSDFAWDLRHNVSYGCYAEDILRYASSRRGENIVKIVKMLLLETDADPSYMDNYALKWASSAGNTDIVRMLLETGKVNVAAGNNFALRKASERGHTDVVSLLLAHGACASAENNEAFCKASWYGHVWVLRLLLQHGADPSARDNLPIRWAIRSYNTDVVRFLLQLGDKRIVVGKRFLENLVEERDRNTRIFKSFQGFNGFEYDYPKHLARLVKRNNKFYRMEKHRYMVEFVLSFVVDT
jgi:ankyrin repeat protein